MVNNLPLKNIKKSEQHYLNNCCKHLELQLKSLLIKAQTHCRF